MFRLRLEIGRELDEAQTCHEMRTARMEAASRRRVDETGVLRIWDIGPDQELFTLLPPAEAHMQEEFRNVLFSPNGSRIFAAYNLRGVDDSLGT